MIHLLMYQCTLINHLKTKHRLLYLKTQYQCTLINHLKTKHRLLYLKTQFVTLLISVIKPMIFCYMGQK